ncbi:GPP34 family phosphoprotein [Streptomyces sp. NPDC047117]|uniref:GPP34 family phosphoprotein n=1 Tax=Streptomyces sp. NPDC047117 TaxID=3155379 RepID=UPI003410AEC2
MTTPRDLLIVAFDVASGHPVDPGDLSLALAGAELIDLLGAEMLVLDGERIVPSSAGHLADRQLDEAASLLVRQMPYESVDDWLWRRGRGLSAAYMAALAELAMESPEGTAEPGGPEGTGGSEGAGGTIGTGAAGVPEGATRHRRRWLPFRHRRSELAADSPARRHAADRLASGEPVLAALAAAAGVHDAPVPADDSPSFDNEAIVTVLAAVNGAVTELEAVRQRRTIEAAAFDNIWRGQ